MENTEGSEGETNSNKESDDDENVDEQIDNQNTNAGWVDSIAKILKTNKPKGKKSLVLSKAKKLTNLKETPKSVGFQVETSDGAIKEENLDPLETLVKKLKEEEPPRKKV